MEKRSTYRNGSGITFDRTLPPTEDLHRLRSSLESLRDRQDRMFHNVASLGIAVTRLKASRERMSWMLWLLSIAVVILGVLVANG